MKLNDEQAKKLKDLTDNLIHEKEQRQELLEILAESAPVESLELQEIERLRTQLEIRRNQCIAKRNARLKPIVVDLNDCEKRIERATDAVKNYCHNLPKEVFSGGGFGFIHNNIRISVSKAEFVTTYKPKQLLEDPPELEEVSLDGDPLCTTTVVPEVLERLLASGNLVIEDIEKYRIVSKARNPSVSIKEVEEE